MPFASDVILQFKLQQEGCDYRTVPDVYVQNSLSKTYLPLTSDFDGSSIDTRKK